MTEDEIFWKKLISTVMPIKINRVKTVNKKLKVNLKKVDDCCTVLDLHGKSIQSAYEKTLAFIEKHINIGNSYVIIITGKGKNNSGIIKKEISGWLNTNKFKQHISNHEWLNGNGAIRLTLKKAKTNG